MARAVAIPQPAKAVLNRLGISQRMVARAIGRDETYVSRALSGERLPTTALVRTVAKMCGQPEAELFRPQRAVQPHPTPWKALPRGERRRARRRAVVRAAVSPVLIELERARAALRRLVDEVPA
jgi:transcriptional regulator with XRE-family HTH domain